MKKLILFIMGAACVLSSCNAQPPSAKNTEIPSSQISPLKIGDTVQDIVFHNMLNYKDSTARLSDFKGKLVILDFWATWCGSCLVHFPDLNRLQEKMKDSLQIILVNTKNTNDTPKKIRALFKKRASRGLQNKLPIIFNDTLLNVFFTHRLIPHIVWIGPNQTVKAFTEPNEVNENSISKMLNNKDLNLRMKIDKINFDLKKPLFIDGNGGNGKSIKYRSLITGYIEGVGSGGYRDIDSNGLITRICFRNTSAIALYKTAYHAYFPPHRIILNIKNPASLKFGGDWENTKYKKAYTYELITPPISFKKVRQRLQFDLHAFFGFKAEIENRQMQCWILKVNKKIPVSKGGKSKNNFSGKEAGKFMRNQSLLALIYHLNHILSKPVIDETSIDYKIDLSLPENMRDIPALKSTLKSQGLILSLSKRNVKCLVISD